MNKRMKALNELVDKNKIYGVDEAIALAKKTSNTKFDASIEAHVRLGVDPKKSEQQIRATVALPHGTGKTKKLAAFVGPNDEKAAKEAGADLVLTEEDIKKIKDTGKFDFEIAVATPEMMPKLASAAKVLGPKGLMPSPKTETVGTDLKKMIGELKKGKFTFKNDDTGNVHQTIGKASFAEAQLKENFIAFMEALKKAKPSSAKGTYIQAIYLSSTMGPGIKVEIIN
ncbi:MAG: 50S ribosomal protein L1 [Candidatus Magasanikbacteria bacterium]|nr:50S ribosomal protein L1 [Candidatus Magasanikbacteria bacterium]